MHLSNEDRRALGIVLGLLLLASGARWLERPRPMLDQVPAMDVAALEAASRAARTEPVAALRAGEKLDPNTATAAELQRLPGVGPAMAARILEERERGAFVSVADLQRVRGIGPALAGRLADRVTLPAETPSTGPPPVAAGWGAAGGIGPPSQGSRATSAPPVTGASPGPGGTPASHAAPGAATVLIDLNRATAAELQAVRGIGPALAARLVARRDSLRGFGSWAEVDAVSGIGPAMLARLQAEAAIGPRPP
jgi:competence ComEA-like helix-hairpin-helix protein